MLGKHFTVSATVDTKPTRHYTICNVMQPQVYSTLVSMLRGSGTKTPINHESVQDLQRMLSTEDTNNMMFVIKNYNQWSGLSEKFFRNDG